MTGTQQLFLIAEVNDAAPMSSRQRIQHLGD